MKRLRLLSLLVLLMTAATGAWADEWTDIIINGDLDGSDRQCFFERENSISSSAIFYAKIRDGIGVDGSRGILVQSNGAEENDWDTQFYIRLPYELPTGTPFRLSFDYKATKSADCDLQSHNEPGEYIHWSTGAPNNFTFGNGWSTFTANNGTVPEECDGQLHGSLYHNFQTLAFSLAKNREATTFYFDNIKFEIPTSVLSELTPKPVTDVMPQYPVDITSMAIMGDFLGQGEVNNWNPTNGWALTQDNSNPAIWKLTREFTAVARTYEYKIFANGNMDDFTLPVPAADKGQFVISEAGDYTLTVTVDTEAGTATVTAAVPGSYTVKMKEGAVDAENWTITPTEATTTGVAEGTSVTLQYNGRLKVKGVKATSDAGAPAAPVQLLTLTVSDPYGYVNGAKTLYYLEGETWGQAITNHTENSGWCYYDTGTKYPTYTGYTSNASVYIQATNEYPHDDTVIDGTKTYKFDI